MATVFMSLLGEGADVWRRVKVTPLDGAIYRVEGPMPLGEAWEFPPGSLIECRWQKFDDHEHRLIPAGSASTVRSTFADLFSRNTGILIGFLPSLAAMNWLPRGPEGRLELVPFFLSNAACALVAVSALIWLKPRALMGKWAIWSMLGFTAIFCFVGI